MTESETVLENDRAQERAPYDAADAWNDVGHRIAWLHIDSVRWDADEAIREICDALRENEPIASDDVRQARHGIDRLRGDLENYVVPLVDGVEPWDDAHRTTPYGVFAEALESHGYEVTRPGE